ncbi:MAG: carboxypeptidase-like regulatory domain-containing protein [bacterium]
MRKCSFIAASLLLLTHMAVAQQGDTVVTAHSGRFIGIIKSSTTGQPVQAADIRLSFLDSVHVSRDADGQQHSEVFVDSVRSRVAATDPAGTFTMRGITRGRYMVQVRRIGFEPFEAALALDTTTVEMELTMTQVARLLPRVVVTTDAMTRVAEKLERTGFAYRRKGSGGGRFIERSDILRMHP